MHTISYSATCWNSPAPASLFNSDTDERSATVMSFSPGAEGAFEGRLLRFSTALDGAGERLTLSQGARQTIWSGGSRAGAVPAPRAHRYTDSPGPRDAAVQGTSANGTSATAGWADVGRQRHPAFRLFASSDPRPGASAARPRSPAGPTRRSRFEPWLIPAGCGTRGVRGASAGKNGRRVDGTRTELPARSVWLGQTCQRSHGRTGPDES